MMKVRYNFKKKKKKKESKIIRSYDSLLTLVHESNCILLFIDKLTLLKYKFSNKISVRLEWNKSKTIKMKTGILTRI